MDKLLSDKQRKELLKLARKTLALYARNAETLKIETDDLNLKEIRGTFVSLHKNGKLRGCIGNIVGTKPLYLGIIDMSISSGFEDSRFSPITEAELSEIDIEISVLSPLEKIENSIKIIMGKHGVLVKNGSSSGVYLPQVASETGWSREEFMNSLCRDKAGISPDAWKTGEAEIYIFTAEVFGEKEVRNE
jgi:AmmeMemoRadiSam system protein A